jgi:hypothetical protein
MTATPPLPAEASEVSWDSAVNDGSMSVTEIAGALALADVAALVAGALVGLVAALELELLELHAAMRRAALTPAAASPALFVALFVT